MLTSSSRMCAYALPTGKGRCSIVVSIPACHAGDPGSIPGSGEAICTGGLVVE
uniref:Uncharacterized protein n=1 Tax=Physcomitrium patens TaxID=3218 RepID=A0A2K1IX91_PHYPA|nr:hypothetical protein PHYPA_023711 [Physcomitrium patens]PNR33896.1 hypothetical protein PHYPA_023712 [Physcomitrium patens]